jgi:hypothetical protein
LAFLVLLNYEELVKIFFRTSGSVIDLNAKSIFKTVLKLLLIVSALCSTLLTKHLFKDSSILKGVYWTEQIKKNSVTVDPKCENDSTLTKMYFDYEGFAIIEYNDHHKRTYNNYKIDKNGISLFFESDHRRIDTLRADINDLANLYFMGKIGNDSVKLSLRKMR